ncbi:hypothetical protein ZOSMA_52G01170 [Zostera marina]|uniref:Uncharacterized protein n=1 Tax=Zostera marina TaxID=29655 RepID=A0A0K9NXF3_ZOSMR|nr:hypothetical protein ZOSMA_52G01170 [Zostera marina]
MGNCVTFHEPTAVAPTSTAKVILPDGNLEEYAAPIRVAQVLLLLNQSTDVFLCDADHMEFNEYVSAIGSDQILHSGQIYFALSKTMLKRRLVKEDMAGLVIRAGSALAKSGVIAVNVDAVNYSTPVDKIRGRRFASELTIIAE